MPHSPWEAKEEVTTPVRGHRLGWGQLWSWDGMGHGMACGMGRHGLGLTWAMIWQTEGLKTAWQEEAARALRRWLFQGRT